MQKYLSPGIIAGMLLLIFALHQIISFNYLPVWYDAHAEYVLSSHILQFNDYPTRGLIAGISTHVTGSTFYYYLLAIPLLWQKQPQILGIVNLLIGIGIAAAIYHIARRLFSPRVAVLAVVFHTFSFYSIANNMMVWQPFFAQLFVYAAYACVLVPGRVKSSLILAGLCLFSLGVLCYLPVIMAAPLVGAACWYRLRSETWRRGFAILSAATVMLTAFGLYAWHVLAAAGPQSFVMYVFRSIPEISGTLFSHGIDTGIQVVLSYYAPGYFGQGIVLGLLTATLLLLFLPVQGTNRRVVLALLLSLCYAILIYPIFTFLIQRDFSAAAHRYFLPFYGWVSIVIAAGFWAVFLRYKVFYSAVVYYGIVCLLAVLLLRQGSYLFSSGCVYSLSCSFHTSLGYGNKIRSFTKPAKWITVIAGELQELRRRHGYASYHFFDVVMVDGADIRHSLRDSSVIWGPLEAAMGERFVRISQETRDREFVTLTDMPEYHLAVCVTNTLKRTAEDCNTDYMSGHPGSVYMKTIYKDQSIVIQLFKV